MLCCIKQIALDCIIFRNSAADVHSHRAAARILDHCGSIYGAAGDHFFRRVISIDGNNDISIGRCNILYCGGVVRNGYPDNAVAVTGDIVLLVDAVEEQFAKAIGGFHRDIRGIYGGLCLLRLLRSILPLQQWVRNNGLNGILVQNWCRCVFLCCGGGIRGNSCARAIRKGTERHNADHHGEGQQSRKKPFHNKDSFPFISDKR